jgi:hypothetical protein
MRGKGNLTLSLCAVVFTGAMQLVRFVQFNGRQRFAAPFSLASAGDLYDEVVADKIHDASTQESSEMPTMWWRGRGAVLNKSHPHLGAIHPDDKSLGWIVDPSVKRLRPAKHRASQTVACPKASNGTLASFGIEGKGGNKVLTKIKGGLDLARQQLSKSLFANTNTSTHPRILCMIYTVSTVNGEHKNLGAIADTWGRRCDGFIGFSNLTDHSVGAIDLAHEGPETYSNSKFFACNETKLIHVFPLFGMLTAANASNDFLSIF